MFYKNKMFTCKNRTFLLVSGLFLLLTVVQKTVSAIESFPFEHISEVNEFSVLTTAIESDGEVIWLGTLNGLIEIQPGETEVFNALTNHTQTNHVSNIVVNESGEVWAAFVGGGVFYFNRNTKEHYLLQEKYPLEDLNCFDLAFDEYFEQLLIACDSALYSLNLGKETLKSHIIHDESGSRVDGFYSLKAVSGKNWLLGTWGQGLFELDSTTFAAERINIKQNYIHHINIASSDSAVISTENGVFLLSLSDKVVNKFSIQATEEIWDPEVISTVSLGENHYLLVFATHGLFEFKADSGLLTEVQLFSPLLEKKHIGYVDTVGLLQKGLSIGIGADERGFYILPLQHSFTRYFESSKMANPDISMMEIIDGSLFIGDWENLVKFEQQKSKIFLKDVGGVQFILPFRNAFIVSTSENGFLVVDEFGYILQRKATFPGLPESDSTNFSEVLQLAQGDYLLGTGRGNTKGIYRGNFEEGFKHVYDSDVVGNMLKISSEKVILTSSYQGVVIYDFVDGTFESYSPDVDDLHIDCLERINEHEYFLCLRRDKALIFNSVSQKFTEFLPEQPVLRNIRDAALDKNGLLWISSSYGLFVFDESVGKVFRITNNEGVKSTDFSPDGILLHENRLIIPGNKGIVEINVDKAKAFLDFKKSQQTQSFITRAEYILDEQSEAQQATAQSIARGLELPHSNIVLKLKFSHNNFLELEDLAFDVRMLGLNNDWNTLDVGEYTATYTTLPPGDYEFQVRVNDPRSLAAQPVQSLRLSILPPWWLTVPAYVSYVILLVLSFYLFSWYRNKRLIALNKELSDKVSERTATITKLLQQKQTFFANVSHEFRTPLSLIMGPLDAIAGAVKGPEHEKHLNIMRRNTSRLMKLVDQILDLAKFETSKSLPKQVYELKSSIEILAASFFPLLEHKKQKLLFENLPEVKVKLVEDSFEIIMTNLLSNAIKYCPRGSEFKISMALKGKSVELQICDNGPGISKENQALLFERFTRFDVAENIQGSGIGLALVKQLVSNNGGDITVESEPGKGTCFNLRLPLNVTRDAEVTRTPLIQVLDSEFIEETSNKNDPEEKDKLPIKPEAKNSTQLQQRARLLIVEDNADLREFLSDSLKDSYELDIAVNGEQGLKKAQEAIPDLILSDVLMPVMDGYELANAIRSDEVTSHIPIILITAKGDDLSRMKGWEEQVDDYISKPFKMSELKIRINRLLSIRDILRKKHTSAMEIGLATKNQKPISFQTKKDAEFFAAFKRVVEEHFSEETFSRTDAAGYLFMEVRQLNRKLAALMDYNFVEYLRKYRLQKSTELLLSGKQVTEVAYDVGFNSPSYFSSCFKAEFDETPSKYVERRESGRVSDQSPD